MATEITNPIGVHEPSLPEVHSSVRISLSPSSWKRLPIRAGMRRFRLPVRARVECRVA